MSHISKIDIEITDLDALKAAARRLGLAFNENQKQHLYYNNQYGQCDHAMCVPNNADAYQIGVMKQPDGRTYGLNWDTYQGGKGLVPHMRAAANRQGADPAGLIKQMYAAEAAKLAARRQGFSAQEQTNPDGSIVVTLRR